MPPKKYGDNVSLKTTVSKCWKAVQKTAAQNIRQKYHYQKAAWKFHEKMSLKTTEPNICSIKLPLETFVEERCNRLLLKKVPRKSVTKNNHVERLLETQPLQHSSKVSVSKCCRKHYNKKSSVKNNRIKRLSIKLLLKTFVKDYRTILLRKSN